MNIELFPLWLVLAIITIPFLVLLIWCWALRDRKPVAPIIIRLKDQAIFMRSGAPCRENPPIYVRLVWVKRSWWPVGMLMPTGETWSCNDPSLYDVVAREYVEAGARELAERSDPSMHESLTDYYCPDCREHFRAPREPGPHPKQVACPKGHVHNTYEACRD